MVLLSNSQSEVSSNPTQPSQQVEPFLLEDLEAIKQNDATATKALPAFVVSTKRGFLPRENPLVKLPPPFENFDSLLQRMTIHQPINADGDRAPGLLALGLFGETVLKELAVDGPEVKEVIRLCEEAKAGRRDTQLLTALFRDYCFATSAYLLEPTDIHYRATGKYAPGRDRLPAQLSIPMVQLASTLGHFPFMEYASSYALVNWRIKDPNFQGPAGPFSFDNLELIRAFEDPTGSERGFILVHIEMVSFSGLVVKATEESIAAAVRGDVKAFEQGLADLLDAYKKINKSMETMWSRSKKEDYLNFRSFIFGTAPKQGNPMFPNGVIYKGTGDDTPRFYRGESGANDSLLPNLDNFLEVTAHLPNNEFTKVLRDFRTYRPQNQREYINHLESRAQQAGIRRFAMETSGSAKAKALYLLLVDQDREIRHRHWNFTKSYIIENSEYPIATGGSPILKYLPHNLAVTLKVLDETFSCFTPSVFDELKSLGQEGLILEQKVQEAGQRADQQRRILEREVEKLKNERSTAGNGMEMGKILNKKPAELNPTNRGSVGCDGVG